MKNSTWLHEALKSMDRQSYAAYKSLKGEYLFNNFKLVIDHIQPDPYAPPSRMHIIISRKSAGFPDEILDNKLKLISASDFLTRIFKSAVSRFVPHTDSTGAGGGIYISDCGQEIIEKSSVIIYPEYIDVRFEVQLPAAGRRIMGHAAAKILAELLPKAVNASLIYKNIDSAALKKQAELTADQEFIRTELKKKKLIAFVADSAILPRESGISRNPMKEATAFKSPPEFITSFKLPSGKNITGMGIPEGITLIVGGGYHGKSTLLKALEKGVYNHRAGDGREFVITVPDCSKIRAEDGRSIRNVNISPFINNLPGKNNTSNFSTENASGSTSQAANVMEAIESGATLLLIDEDTSATNFMIRDKRMQQLVADNKEPITPFIDKARVLYDELNISSVIIAGGSGDYFDIADRVIMMDEYIPFDVTDKAREIADMYKVLTKKFDHKPFGRLSKRLPLKAGFSKSGRMDTFKAKGAYTILYGDEAIDLSYLEQLTGSGQTDCIAAILGYIKDKLIAGENMEVKVIAGENMENKLIAGKNSDTYKSKEKSIKLPLPDVVDMAYKTIGREGIAILFPYTNRTGNLVLPRKQEVCAALNRYRGLSVECVEV